MKDEIGINCPVSGVKGDEKVIRIIAFLVSILAATSLYYNLWPITFILACDFGMRAFRKGNYSPLKYLATKISRLFHLKQKPADLAPKKFAALLGYAFTVTIFVLQIFNGLTATYIIGSVLILCAFLESIFSVCIGCIMYAQLQRFKWTQPLLNK